MLEASMTGRFLKWGLPVVLCLQIIFVSFYENKFGKSCVFN